MGCPGPCDLYHVFGWSPDTIPVCLAVLWVWVLNLISLPYTSTVYHCTQDQENNEGCKCICHCITIISLYSHLQTTL